MPSSPEASATPVPTRPTIPGVQSWTTIKPGETAKDLTFTQEGGLTVGGRSLLSEIPVSYSSDGSVTYAKRLVISDASPSGTFNFVKACESPTDETGLCWAVYLVNRQQNSAKQTSVGKYGGLNWVQWSEDERYAVLVEQMEGVFRFVAVDLQTGDSKSFDETYSKADLTSFRWVNDSTFEVSVTQCEGANCSNSSLYRGDAKELLAQP